ncbi:hypothetical protein KUH03_39840 [Sphingobacterium sp. E70]|uniref:hypothetical protein n=1 Tax=Sphingobacterium sp. E70 TaxID=2853439 RepID=UPI00211D086D|nr:hypothetical protein [Sphingobacterium sp. E70]ULT24963.1 hypothetical protein KUH03_39840 [Sphingobacterium sp. E70]
MYIGTTAKERLDHFVVIEKGDTASEILVLMKEKQVFNLIVDGKTCDEAVIELPEFRAVFAYSNIIYLSNIKIDTSEKLYTFKNAVRLEIKQCTFKEKVSIDWLIFERLVEVFTPYSKSFINLFEHPTLKTIFVEKFNQENYQFPANRILETLSIAGSVASDWSTLPQFVNLKALYLSEITSLTGITWISNFHDLIDLELSLCQHVENIVASVSEVITLRYLYIFRSGVIESLQNLAKLTNLIELTIENKGKLLDKNISYLDKKADLEYSVEIGSFAATSD